MATAATAAIGAPAEAVPDSRRRLQHRGCRVAERAASSATEQSKQRGSAQQGCRHSTMVPQTGACRDWISSVDATRVRRWGVMHRGPMDSCATRTGACELTAASATAASAWPCSGRSRDPRRPPKGLSDELCLLLWDRMAMTRCAEYPAELTLGVTGWCADQDRRRVQASRSSRWGLPTVLPARAGANNGSSGPINGN